MAKKPKLDEEFADINIMPLMNIIMLLIPFLIMSTEFLKIGIINVSAPKIGGAASASNPDDKPKKPLNLTVQIDAKGFTLLTQSQKLPQGCDLAALKAQGEKKFPTIPKKSDGKYDYEALHNCLKRIKKVFPNERQVIIMSDPGISYYNVIGVMDASRSISSGNKKKGDEELFPVVVISAGVV